MKNIRFGTAIRSTVWRPARILHPRTDNPRPWRGCEIGTLLIASSDPALLRRLAPRLRRVADVRRVHVAMDRAGVEQALAAQSPAVLLLDTAMRGFERPDRIRTIRLSSPATATILLAASPDDALAIRALKTGAKGYCPRATDPALLAKAVALVQRGEIWVGRKVMLKLIDELTALHQRRADHARERLRRLTPRERQISGLIAAGASNKEIARRLLITERTVKAHLTNIFQKLGFSSRLHLAIFTLQEGAGTRTNVQ